MLETDQISGISSPEQILCSAGYTANLVFFAEFRRSFAQVLTFFAILYEKQSSYSKRGVFEEEIEISGFWIFANN